MKKILLIVFVLTFVVSFTSCRDKREQDRAKYQVEKVKKDINDAADKISDKAEDSACLLYTSHFALAIMPYMREKDLK